MYMNTFINDAKLWDLTDASTEPHAIEYKFKFIRTTADAPFVIYFFFVYMR